MIDIWLWIENGDLFRETEFQGEFKKLGVHRAD